MKSKQARCLRSQEIIAPTQGFVTLFRKATTYGKLGDQKAARGEFHSMVEDRIISADTGNDDEKQFELSLRPKWLREYIGQQKAKENLSIFIQAARKRGQALDHVLLYGPPGLGKKTLAHIIA